MLLRLSVSLFFNGGLHCSSVCLHIRAGLLCLKFRLLIDVGLQCLSVGLLIKGRLQPLNVSLFVKEGLLCSCACLLVNEAPRVVLLHGVRLRVDGSRVAHDRGNAFRPPLVGEQRMRTMPEVGLRRSAPSTMKTSPACSTHTRSRMNPASQWPQ